MTATTAEKPTAIAAPPDPKAAVIHWLISGHAEGDIREAMAAKFPGVDPMPVLIAAGEHFANASHCDLDVVIGWSLEAYRDLFRRMVAIGDFANAARVVKELATLAAKHCRRAETES